MFRITDDRFASALDTLGELEAPLGMGIETHPEVLRSGRTMVKNHPWYMAGFVVKNRRICCLIHLHHVKSSHLVSFFAKKCRFRWVEYAPRVQPQWAGSPK